jgi:branched-chain amino acid aminotransferase
VSRFDPSGLYVYVDGDFVDGAEARISVFDHGLLYGDGVFEGLRLFSSALFRPRDHLARLARSARAIRLELPLDTEELLAATTETVRRSRLTDAHVRIVVTRGFGTPGLDPARCEQPTLIIAAYPFPPHLGTDPLHLLTSSVVRKAPRSLGAHIKSLNYLDAIQAYQQARAAGASDAIMLDVFGAVAECTSTNLFAVIQGVLVTPTTRAALPGITRQTVLEFAAEQAIPCEVREVWPSELHTADAAFVTGSGAGIVPVASVDGFPLNSLNDSIVSRVSAGYRERTRSSRFLVPVNEPSALQSSVSET